MSFPAWSELRPGAKLTIIKLAPEGAEAARYRGEVVGVHEAESWCVVQATWTYGAMNIDGLAFRTGDALLEWFSPKCPFNAFAVYSPGGELRGWYANVTYPSYLQVSSSGADDEATLIWHDLYLDLIGLPDGSFVIRDREELEESGISTSDPAVYQMILDASEELGSRFEKRQVPFQHSGFDNGLDQALDRWK
jgi:hypothetical protein